MDETHTLKSGKTDGWREAFCLETQHFPDAVHHDHFPSVILKPEINLLLKRYLSCPINSIEYYRFYTL